MTRYRGGRDEGKAGQWMNLARWGRRKRMAVLRRRLVRYMRAASGGRTLRRCCAKLILEC